MKTGCPFGFLFVFSIVCFVFLNSCKKQTDSTLDFNYSVTAELTYTEGCLQTTIKLDSDYLWDFGDGTISADSTNFCHVYRSGGTYEVKLFSNKTPSLIKKNISVPSPKYRALMAGTRLWHHFSVSGTYGGSLPPDTVINSDVSFSINFINDTSILFYNSQTLIGNRNQYQNIYEVDFENNNNYNTTISLVYYFSDNSLYYIENIGGSGGYEKDIYQTF